jgi:copper chaperone
MSTQLNISGMTCGHCVAAVSKALKSVPGVQDAQVELSSGTATVEGQADVQALIAAVVEEGYSAHVQPSV